MMKLRCLVVEDQAMFLELLLIALRCFPELEIARTARTFAEASEAICGDRFDLAIIDYMLPDGSGLDLMNELGRSSPETMGVILTAHVQALEIRQAIASDDRMRAVVDKVKSLEGLRTAITEFIRERTPLSGRGKVGVHTQAILSRREMEVFEQLGAGLPTKEIAMRLFISQRTVETHRKKIASKLGMSGAELVRHAALFWPDDLSGTG